jgi:hypothetical protein
MKISEIKQCDPGSEPKPAKTADGHPGEFSRLLAEESEKMGETIRGAESGMERMTLPSIADFRLAAVRDDFSQNCRTAELAVEGTIDRLEELQLALQDPKGGLKNVAAAIGGLTSAATELQDRVTSLPQNHPLRQMANELSVLACVESVKYKRGDYL